MTQRWCSGRAQVIVSRAPNPRHCESRSDVAIHDFERTAMDRFVPRDDAVVVPGPRPSHCQSRIEPPSLRAQRGNPDPGDKCHAIY
jgi:hypothetical protein